MNEKNYSCEQNKKSNLIAITMLFIFFITIFVSMIILTGCTYNISMAHTSGTADDVIDDNATNTPSTSLSVPVSIVPKPSV